ncbi:MAG: glucosidase [Phycisphaerae bacterium]|nr:glucosidase [Phycisphaerae bacterium]
MSLTDRICAEELRITQSSAVDSPWRRWGPFVTERQWGTVREDYSKDGAAWDSFPYEHARSRAYRWGEDGIAGWCDLDQRMTLSLALWNGADAHLKERLFGLANAQGNHGEDVKELYWYLDAMPSHAWQRMQYKYPQRAFPYAQLIEENAKRTRLDREFELIDTGIFDDDRYFDVTIDYAKPDPASVIMRVTVANRGPKAAVIDVVPQACFRNEWTWKPQHHRPTMTKRAGGNVLLKHVVLGEYVLTAYAPHDTLFCENETNGPLLWGLAASDVRYKDGLNDAIVHGRADACSPDHGTKVGFRHHLSIPAGEERSILLHLGPAAAAAPAPNKCEAMLTLRRGEADEWWSTVQHAIDDSDRRMVQRQAFAGLLWSKQFYHFDIRRWLDGDPGQPPPEAARRHGRNQHWRHFAVREVMAMPDTWEYPWFAAWDQAFHAVAFARIDPDFSKRQISRFLTDAFVHPNGALPAYEWAFDDANPPIHAWAAWRVYQIDKKIKGAGDLDFLIHVLNRLSMNFTWWVNRKDSGGRNVFEGGFLGLDNIGVFDRSQPIPLGGSLQQADGTAWMGMYALSLMRIAIELAVHFPVYEDLATKFFEHFLQIAEAMADIHECGTGLWDEADGFYYDLMMLPDGTPVPLKILSAVGLVPLFCVETLEPETLAKLPLFTKRLEWIFKSQPQLAGLVSRWNEPGRGDRRLLSLLRGHRMKAILRKAFDPAHFLSPHGVRSLSRRLKDAPYEIALGEQHFTVGYEPGEGETSLFGGNSNWRGPIWFPINFLLVESLEKFHHYYGDEFRIEAPVGSGREVSLLGAADLLRERLSSLFLRDAAGRRPVFGSNAKLQSDPHFRDLIPFFEYFHGETGEGLGARAQTGWTALAGKLMLPHGSVAGAVTPH